MLFVTGHFGYWELQALVHGLRLQPMSVMARALDNPLLHDLLERMRTRTGNGVIYRQGTLRRALRLLQAGGSVGILIDQSLSSGLLVDFFGRPAGTTTLPALLHMRTGAPVVMTYTLREADRFRHVFRPVVFPPVSEDADRILIYTKTINTLFEDLIRRYPENWFWVHNRWKRDESFPETATAPSQSAL